MRVGFVRTPSIATLMDRHRGLVVAVVVASVAAFSLLRTMPTPQRIVLAWDILAALFLLTAWTGFVRSGAHDIRRQAASYNVNDGIVLMLCLLGVVASLIALVGLLTNAKNLAFPAKELQMGLAILTVTLSWLFLHTVLALHYAHSYFLPNPRKTESGGLQFPGDEPPDYFDFLYFSFVIGATSQTSDVAITAKPIRRLVLLHGTVTFAFNVVLLALLVNAAASLF